MEAEEEDSKANLQRFHIPKLGRVVRVQGRVKGVVWV